MSERLEKIKNYYSSMESLHPDIQEDMKWLISRVEGLENHLKLYDFWYRTAYEQNKRYREALERIQKNYPVLDADYVPVEMIYEIQLIISKALEGEC